jgi:hypothetical protein
MLILECGDMSPPLKRGHVRTLQNFVWFALSAWGGIVSRFRAKLKLSGLAIDHQLSAINENHPCLQWTCELMQWMMNASMRPFLFETRKSQTAE